MKKVIYSVDELVNQIVNGLKKESNSYGEPCTYVHIAEWDDEDQTMLDVRITEEREGLDKSEYFYKAEIIISTNDDVIDDDNVLCSEGLGEDILRELAENLIEYEPIFE